MSMQTVRRIADVRRVCSDARRSDRTVGLVPTMGAFHAGHRSLMRAARGDCDLVVVSLFVNPTQFGPNEDLAGYPRDEEGDASAAAAEGVDLLFAPSVDEMYPDEPRTTVHVAGLTDRLCGASRPGHFDGVTTVVAKLFSIVGPCRAYFGRKDAQQLAVVRTMARDLDLPVEVVGCPLVRELVGAEPLVDLEYVEVVDASTLEPIDGLTGEVLVALAARVGKARLIDNCTITVLADGSTAADLGVLA